MTISTTTRRAGPFSGNDVTTSFPFSFKVFAETDVQVFVTDALVTTELTLDVDYSVAVNADQDDSPGGTVTYPLTGDPLAAGTTLDVQGNVAYTQPAALPQGGNFSPRVIENALDRLTMQTIQLADAIDLGPIPGGVSLSGLPNAAARANYLLGFDSSGNPTAVAPVSGSAADLALSLLDDTDDTKGASLVAFSVNRAYASGVGKKLLEIRSVTDFDGVIGDGVNDDTGGIQTAVSSGYAIYFPIPRVKYLVSAEISVPSGAHLFGANGKRTFIEGTHAGVIFRLAYLPIDNIIEGLYFQGSGCTGIAAATSGGAFAPYLARGNIRRCHFSFDLAYGINADLINSHIDSCSFGYSGPDGIETGWVGTMVAIRSHYTGTNYVNINSVNRCVFKVGTATVAGIQLTAGTLFHFNYCDFEGGGKVLAADNIQGLKFTGCWFENSTTSTGVIVLGDYTGWCTFDNCWIAAGDEAAQYFLTWASSWGSNGLAFRGCNVGLGSNTNLVYDSTTGSSGPVPDGRFRWEDSFIAGGRTSNVLRSTIDITGRSGVKAWAVIDTSGSASVISSSDPGINLSRNGTGDVNIGWSYPLASSAAKQCPVATGQSSYVIATGISTGQFTRVLAFNRTTGVAKDDVINVMVQGN